MKMTSFTFPIDSYYFNNLIFKLKTQTIKDQLNNFEVKKGIITANPTKGVKG